MFNRLYLVHSLSAIHTQTIVHIYFISTRGRLNMFETHAVLFRIKIYNCDHNVNNMWIHYECIAFFF